MGKYKSQDWLEAKKRCHLNQADIQMAKELGMTLPHTLPDLNKCVVYFY